METSDPLGELAADPGRAAILLDVDGTLAPIVLRPEDARVPDATRAELQRLHGTYGLVACISGRPGQEAAQIVGLPELTYVGEHGLELAPEAEVWAPRVAAFADAESRQAERKPLSLSFHFREDPDQAAARRQLREVERRAREAELVPRWGRKVLEIRPPVAANKGTAVRALLDRAGLRRALYAGDDVTDLDAFRALDGLEFAVRVAMISPEGPAELATLADIEVAGTEEFLALLRRL